MTDRSDGTYEATLRPAAVGEFSLTVSVAGEALGVCPFAVQVMPDQATLIQRQLEKRAAAQVLAIRRNLRVTKGQFRGLVAALWLARCPLFGGSVEPMRWNIWGIGFKHDG